jgi:hypothetical protein
MVSKGSPRAEEEVTKKKEKREVAEACAARQKKEDFNQEVTDEEASRTCNLIVL